MQEEDFVHHLGQPAWGFGRVLVCLGDGKCRAIFADGQMRTLDLKIAGAKLLSVARSEILADSPLLRADWRTPKKPAAPKAVCAHCQKLLNRARFSAAHDWKSCPNCSTTNGSEHVFWPYPTHFGETEVRAKGKNPGGLQSHCNDCRREKNPPSGAGTLCSKLASK